MKTDVKQYIPNCVTFINLSLGFSSIIVALEGDIQLGCLLVLIAGVVDRFDGKVARKLHAVSDLGKELDSLCDLVSFGVAPAALMWETSLNKLHNVGFILVIAFVICGAYRLARFNITQQTETFMGIPITIAGCLLVLDNLFVFRYGPHPYLSSFYVVLLSFLMVSNISIKKL